jgi:hypothetical protein
MFVLCTRDRPHLLLEFIECWHNTKASSPVTVLIDDNDPKIDQYKAIEYPKNWTVLYNKSAKPIIKINNWFQDNMHHDFYGNLADDLRPKTVEWDKKLIEVAKNNQIAYPNDTIQCEKLCTHPVIGGDLVRATGWLFNTELIHFYGDDVWMHIGTQTNKLHYLGDVICQHLHHSVGTRKADETSANLDKSFATDRQIYTNWVNNPKTIELIEKIRKI